MLISTATVKGRLLSKGLREYMAAKKTILTYRHEQKRLDWAKTHTKYMFISK